MSDILRLGIIGCGLMGREIASAAGRWFALDDMPARLDVTAVCDTDPSRMQWFEKVPTVKLLTTDRGELVRSGMVDAVYAAVPHHLHEEVYCDALDAGLDLLAEKPFGVDLASARRIQDRAKASCRFVRVSSEFPFYPAAQIAISYVQSGALGKMSEARFAFLHSSDMDPNKPINWKRQVQFCGEAGVMNDLGLHVFHAPLRLGIQPESVFAQLQNLVAERPDGKGGIAPCDTWDNATLHCLLREPNEGAIASFEMKRLAPGETNTWIFETLGTKGGVRFSTKEPKTLSIFEAPPSSIVTRQSSIPSPSWRRIDVGHSSAFPVATGGIFEFGFPDAILQMLAAFVTERAGVLGSRFGCATPEEAVSSHTVFDAALRSQREGAVAKVKQ